MRKFIKSKALVVPFAIIYTLHITVSIVELVKYPPLSTIGA